MYPSASDALEVKFTESGTVPDVGDAEMVTLGG
jgi:hypothetical protein